MTSSSLSSSHPGASTLLSPALTDRGASPPSPGPCGSLTRWGWEGIWEESPRAPKPKTNCHRLSQHRAPPLLRRHPLSINLTRLRAPAHAGKALWGGARELRACAQPLSCSAGGRPGMERLNLPLRVLSPLRLSLRQGGPPWVCAVCTATSFTCYLMFWFK